jgi:fructose 1,6-bisphosphatase
VPETSSYNFPPFFIFCTPTADPVLNQQSAKGYMIFAVLSVLQQKQRIIDNPYVAHFSFFS